MTVVVPTLVADSTLDECLSGLDRQTRRDFEVIIVDNSGQRRVRERLGVSHACVIENDTNAGFGAAVNQAAARSGAPFLAVLNDDAKPEPGWLEAMLRALEQRDDAGMCAPQIRMAGKSTIDSAGMLVCGDGSSKQRGHGEPAERYGRPFEALFPSGCAALYRRAMLDEIGGFDETFFLYCEDTDLGLRARWAGWECLYVPEAVVEHRYSHSAGGASPLKAWLVERNRVFLVLKNFPLRMLAVVPWYVIQRYFWHLVTLRRGEGKAGQFREAGNGGWRLPWYAVRAHLEAVRRLRQLWRERRRIRKAARLTPRQFARLVRSHSISPRQVAAL